MAAPGGCCPQAFGGLGECCGGRGRQRDGAVDAICCLAAACKAAGAAARCHATYSSAPPPADAQCVAAQQRLEPDGFTVPTSRFSQHRWVPAGAGCGVGCLQAERMAGFWWRLHLCHLLAASSRCLALTCPIFSLLHFPTNLPQAQVTSAREGGGHRAGSGSRAHAELRQPGQ